MNFFERQAQARSSTRRMVFLFVLAVIAIIAAIDLVVLAIAVAGQGEGAEALPAAEVAGQYAGLLAWTSLVTLVIIALSSLYKSARLRAGGAAVMKSLKAVPLPPTASDFRYKRLRNVIEEMAIASGTPVPAIYVLEDEAGINAFAAGYSPADAAVAVTRGALDKLSRDELQGVIAHEFSHVVNGDMRLNINLMGVIFGILVVHIIAREIFSMSARGGGGSKKDGGAIVLAALAIMVIGWVGVFFARLIKAGVSRSREHLADASAVQFTRQASGIAGALKKIAGLTQGSKLKGAHTEEVSHMLFGDGIGYSSLFATHPPLAERIRLLDPSFKPEQIQAKARQWNDPSWLAQDEALAGVSGFASGSATVAADSSQVAQQVGNPREADLRYGEAVVGEMPAALMQAAHDDQGAAELVLALLLDPDPAARAAQLALIEPALGAPWRERVMQRASLLDGLPPALRLPLLSIAFPALRRRQKADLARLVRVAGQLIQADAHVSAFEYCLGRLLRVMLADALHPSASNPNGRLSLDQCEEALQTLFSVLAQQGHRDEAAARQACLAGLNRVLPRKTLSYAPSAQWTAALDGALVKLDRLAPQAKEVLIEGLAATIAHDGRTTVAEAELLRVICAVLHCPLPPTLAA